MREYAYRAKRRDGGGVSGKVAAESRDAALRALRREGLVVVSLREACAGKEAARGAWRGFAVAAAALVAVAAALYTVLRPGRGGDAAARGKETRPAETAALATPAKPCPAAPEDAGTGAAPPALSPPGLPRKGRASARPQDTDAPRSGSGTGAIGREEAPVPEPRPKAFKTGAEQLLAMVIPASPGAPVPPLPALTEAGLSNDLARALEAEIVIGTNDTEETAALKESVAALKAQYRELRKAEGWGFAEYLDAMRKQGEEDAAILGAARRELRELWENRDVSDADYLRQLAEINAILKERGLPEETPPDL